MQNEIKQEIKKICLRIIKKNASEAKKEASYKQQFTKRTGLLASVGKPAIAAPKPRHFDPIYCKRNANFLAKTIWYKVLSQSYEPRPAINYLIPKPDGSKRSIMAFSIPDAAIANVLMRRVRERNKKRMSPFSYAYHDDKNLFDAIISLNSIPSDGKLFAVQIDFEKYFDSIQFNYIEGKLDNKLMFSVTEAEKHIFSRLLRHQFAPPTGILTGPFKRRRIGTPQGSSASLILANIANHDLDVRLSFEAGHFVRFADDVVALCSTYQDAQRIEQCFIDHCRESNLVVNKTKSPGIAIISESVCEIRTYKDFNYLGYRFARTGLSIPDKSVHKIKVRISRLINIYLIQYLKVGYNAARASSTPNPFDWDLLGLLYEIRNALYGGLTEAQLANFIENGVVLPQMKGLMGFYCLIEDPSRLRELDGWILSAIRRAQKHRANLIASKYAGTCPTPNRKQLATGTWLDTAAWRGPPFPDARAPSMVRGWRAARKHFFTFGLERVAAPRYGFYDELDDVFGY